VILDYRHLPYAVHRILNAEKTIVKFTAAAALARLQQPAPTTFANDAAETAVRPANWPLPCRRTCGVILKIRRMALDLPAGWPAVLLAGLLASLQACRHDGLLARQLASMSA
jgi:hypothetical protein